MAGKDDLKKVMANALFDKGFREKLQTDPKKASSDLGIVLDDEQVKFLDSTFKQLGTVEFTDLPNIDISVAKQIDLTSGKPIDVVSSHGSVSW